MKATIAFKQYKNSKILTASPAELTLMLYDGCIKFCNMAVMAINGKDFAAANQNIRKAERIIGEFQMTLDHKYEVAKDFKASRGERSQGYGDLRRVHHSHEKPQGYMEGSHETDRTLLYAGGSTSLRRTTSFIRRHICQTHT